MQPATLMLILLLGSTAESIQYVTPNTLEDCPGEPPCLTLDQYILESSQYFTTGATFVFLPGNHSLNTSLTIATISNISFRGADIGPQAIIVCTDVVNVNNVTGLDINRITFMLQLTGSHLSAFVFSSSQAIAINDSVFRNGSIPSPGRAILSADTSIMITNCLFEGNTGNGYGGALFALSGTIMTLSGNIFSRNQATTGGAIYAEKSAHIVLKGNAIFSNNEAQKGGAIGIDGGSLYATGSANFSNNKAIKGGAISIQYSRAEFSKGIFMFEGNVAKHIGGGVYIASSSFLAHEGNFTFIDNTAEGSEPYEVCGVMCVHVTNISENSVVISVTLLNNSGTAGGALFIEKTGNYTFYSICARNNLGGAFGILYATANVLGTNLFSNNSNLKLSGAITVTNGSVILNGNNTFDHNYADKGAISLTNNSNAIFLGNNSIVNNIGRFGGGGITTVDSAVSFIGNTSFCNNIGRSGGGAIYSLYSTVSLIWYTSFCNNSGPVGGAILTERGTLQLSIYTAITNNVATTYGGGIFASGTAIKFESSIRVVMVTFSFNSAESGGAMYLKFGTTLTLRWPMELNMNNNTATEYGGGAYIMRTP